MTELTDVDLFLFDLDGTLYLDETPIGDAAGTLARLRERGKRIVFLTNNSSKTEEEYRAKLRRIGLFSAGDGVYTSAMAAEEFLNREYAGKKVFLLATEAVKAEFRGKGICLDEEEPDVLVLAYDTTLTFDKIKRFDAFLRRGKPFIATHPDDVCPTADGSMPDVGSFLAMFFRSSGRHADIIGKPEGTMGEYLSLAYQIPLSRICMVGDRMHTDIRFANRLGMKSILVLSGETTRESMKNFPDRPDLVLPDVNALV